MIHGDTSLGEDRRVIFAKTSFSCLSYTMILGANQVNERLLLRKVPVDRKEEWTATECCPLAAPCDLKDPGTTHPAMDITKL